jgi:hypothetical protein
MTDPRSEENHVTQNPSTGPGNGADSGGLSLLFSLIAVLLLLFMAILMGGSIRRESAGFDEPTHIGAGVSYLQKLDLRMNPEHPPLAKILAALPLVIHGVHADYSNPAWTVSGEFPGSPLEYMFGASLQTHWNDPATTLKWGRAPMLLLTLVLGWIVFVYGRRLGGDWGGLLCLSLYVSMPVFLAFGPLVLTDVAITLLSLTTLWTFAEVWRDPSRKNVMIFALSLTGALLSKFTAGILFFAFAAFALSTCWRPVPGQPGEKLEARIWRRLRWQATGRGILWAALFVYVVYFILSVHQPTDPLARLSHGHIPWPLRRLLMPAALYLFGVVMVVFGASRPAFILSHAYKHGVWFYFPVLFLFKSPLGFLGLLVLAIALALLLRRRGEATAPSILPEKFGLHWRVLWTSFLVFTVFCIVARLNIGYRHFSVPLILMILLLAPLPHMLKRLGASRPVRARLVTPLVALLALSCLFTAVHAYPFYLPYVNGLGLGHPVYTIAGKADVDWGQAMPEVARFVEQHGLQTIEVDIYGHYDPSVTVPQARLWNCQNPTAADQGQWVVLSANMILDGHNCVWLMGYPHEALGGGSMYAVQLPPQIPAAGSPGGPPLPADQREMFGGKTDYRPLMIDWVNHPDKLAAFIAEQRAKYAKVHPH